MSRANLAGELNLRCLFVFRQTVLMSAYDFFHRLGRAFGMGGTKFPALARLGRTLRWVAVRIPAVTFAGLVLLIAAPLVTDWWKQHQKDAEAQEKKDAVAKVGIDASLAAMAVWGAYKECRKIGIQDIVQCSQYKAVLLQEQAAPILAKTAVDMRADYNVSCRKQYQGEYCDHLLNRAFHLSQNEP